MLDAFSHLLCSKLFWHNRLAPSYLVAGFCYGAPVVPISGHAIHDMLECFTARNITFDSCSHSNNDSTVFFLISQVKILTEIVMCILMASL